jgi:flagellar hook assembly protein FlgD
VNPRALQASASVVVSVYDEVGRLVRRLELGRLPAGRYEVRENAAYWDGRNSDGEPVASGVYYVELDTGTSRQIRRLTVTK